MSSFYKRLYWSLLLFLRNVGTNIYGVHGSDITSYSNGEIQMSSIYDIHDVDDFTNKDWYMSIDPNEIFSLAHSSNSSSGNDVLVNLSSSSTNAGFNEFGGTLSFTNKVSDNTLDDDLSERTKQVNCASEGHTLYSDNISLEEMTGNALKRKSLDISCPSSTHDTTNDAAVWNVSENDINYECDDMIHPKMRRMIPFAQDAISSTEKVGDDSCLQVNYKCHDSKDNEIPGNCLSCVTNLLESDNNDFFMIPSNDNVLFESVLLGSGSANNIEKSIAQESSSVARQSIDGGKLSTTPIVNTESRMEKQLYNALLNGVLQVLKSPVNLLSGYVCYGIKELIACTRSAVVTSAGEEENSTLELMVRDRGIADLRYLFFTCDEFMKHAGVMHIILQGILKNKEVSLCNFTKRLYKHLPLVSTSATVGMPFVNQCTYMYLHYVLVQLEINNVNDFRIDSNLMLFRYPTFSFSCRNNKNVNLDSMNMTKDMQKNHDVFIEELEVAEMSTVDMHPETDMNNIIKSFKKAHNEKFATEKSKPIFFQEKANDNESIFEKLKIYNDKIIILKRMLTNSLQLRKNGDYKTREYILYTPQYFGIQFCIEVMELLFPELYTDSIVFTANDYATNISDFEFFGFTCDTEKNYILLKQLFNSKMTCRTRFKNAEQLLWIKALNECIRYCIRIFLSFMQKIKLDKSFSYDEKQSAVAIMEKLNSLMVHLAVINSFAHFQLTNRHCTRNSDSAPGIDIQQIASASKNIKSIGGKTKKKMRGTKIKKTATHWSRLPRCDYEMIAKMTKSMEDGIFFDINTTDIEIWEQKSFKWRGPMQSAISEGNEEYRSIVKSVSLEYNFAMFHVFFQCLRNTYSSLDE